MVDDVPESTHDPLASRDELIRSLRAGYEQLREETCQQQWLAQELHDGLLQDILAARLQLAGIDDLASAEKEQRLEQIARLLDDAISEARQLVGEIRTVQSGQGLAAALEKLVERAGRGDLGGRPLVVQLDTGNLEITDEAVIGCLLRVACECLVNVARHAKTDRAGLVLSLVDGQLGLEVQDEGVGFLVDEVSPGCLGLEGMRERLAACNGTLGVESSAGQGTRIRARLPWPKVNTAE